LPGGRGTGVSTPRHFKRARQVAARARDWCYYNVPPTGQFQVGARAREWYDVQAKERQKEAGKLHGRGKAKLPVNLPEANSGDTRDQAAR
jgi:hypothetical protein